MCYFAGLQKKWLPILADDSKHPDEQPITALDSAAIHALTHFFAPTNRMPIDGTPVALRSS
jgi:hypothetical protein